MNDDTPRARSGAHRPRRSPAQAAVPVGLGLAGLLAVAVAATGLGGQDGVASGSGTGAARSTSATSGTTGAASSPASPATATGPVDRSLRVTVLNGTRQSGLAGRAAGTLRSAGWTVQSTGNFRGDAAPTTVYYAAATQRATAEAVARDVGSPARVSQSGSFSGSQLTVVLGTDYPG